MINLYLIEAHQVVKLLPAVVCPSHRPTIQKQKEQDLFPGQLMCFGKQRRKTNLAENRRFCNELQGLLD